jgi:hypothetical protein
MSLEKKLKLGQKDRRLFFISFFILGFLLMRGAMSYPEKGPETVKMSELLALVL